MRLNVLFGIAAGNFQIDQFQVRLQYGNSGRVFFAPQYFPGNFGDFGTTCSGSGKEAIRGENGKRFARLVCKTLGFAEGSGVVLNFSCFITSIRNFGQI